MKKTFLAFMLAASMHAADMSKGVSFTAVTGQTIPEHAAYLVGLDSANGVFRYVQTNPDGSLDIHDVSGIITADQGTPGSQPWPVAITSTVTTNGTANQGTPGANPWPVTVTSLPALTAPDSGLVWLSAVSYTATVVNLTSVAGVNSNCMICLSSDGGSAGFNLDFFSGATAPGGVTGTAAYYVAATTTGQCWGPWRSGTKAAIAGRAATSSVQYGVYPVQ